MAIEAKKELSQATGEEVSRTLMHGVLALGVMYISTDSMAFEVT